MFKTGQFEYLEGEDNIKMDPREICCEDRSGKNCLLWCVVVNFVINDTETSTSAASQLYPLQEEYVRLGLGKLALGKLIDCILPFFLSQEQPWPI